jgi:hypothetical protein
MNIEKCHFYDKTVAYPNTFISTLRLAIPAKAETPSHNKEYRRSELNVSDKRYRILAKHPGDDRLSRW